MRLSTSTARLFALPLSAMTAVSTAPASGFDRVSSPGLYEGYSPVLYEGYQRSSTYVPVRGGTRLAIDIYRPTLNGVPVETKMPVVWMHTPYNRRGAPGGPDAAEAYAGNALQLVKYGYVVATVDFRGLYASFGVNRGYNQGSYAKAAWNDAYDVTEWLSRQNWSTGKIGMWGCSATGGSAVQAAITEPPHLRAIMDMSSEFDAYSWAAPGGLAQPTGDTWQPTLEAPWRAAVAGHGAAPVDGPQGQQLLAKAIASHALTVSGMGHAPFRDSASAAMQMDNFWAKRSPYGWLDALRRSGIGIYATSTWNERQIKEGAFSMAGNLPQQTKLLVGPQKHCRWDLVRQEQGFDIVKEELRFFDYWLKGVQNGVMTEPRVTYYTYNAPKWRAWSVAEHWPLRQERRTNFYLGEQSLRTAAPAARYAQSARADYDTTPADFDEKSNRDEKGILYATAPLDRDIEVTGYPTVDLWASSSSSDADVIATLEDVAPDGAVTSYNMFGMLRASHRALTKAPYNNFGIPWHSHRQGDVTPLTPGVPVELQFQMQPMSYIFQKGHRIRLVLTFADRVRTPHENPAPTLTVHSGPTQPSFLTLPIIPAPASRGAAANKDQQASDQQGR